MSKLGILIIDDSAFMRRLLSDIISTQPDMEVIDTARNGQEGLAKLEQHYKSVNVVTLDVEMPVMDGITCLKKIMSTHPTRVLMVSSLTKIGATVTLDALDAGACDFIAKPGGSISLEFKSVAPEFLNKIRAVGLSNLNLIKSKPTVKPVETNIPPKTTQPRSVVKPSLQPEGTQPISTPSVTPSVRPGQFKKIVLLACSTGGPKALYTMVPMLPKNLPAPIVIVQHMPAGFTNMLAHRLNSTSDITVREAKNGDYLTSGVIDLCPGGHHLIVEADGRIKLSDDPPIHGLRPCADITMLSAAPQFHERIVGVVLTGMGHDGTEGCKLIKKLGGYIISESQQTCIIYGMPRSVEENGLSNKVVPIESIAQAISYAVQ